MEAIAGFRTEVVQKPEGICINSHWRKHGILGIEKTFVVSNSMAGFIHCCEAQIDAASVGTCWPSLVQVGNPQLSLPISVGQMNPEPERETCCCLIGTVLVMRSHSGIIYCTPVHEIHVALLLGLAHAKSRHSDRRSVVEEPEFAAVLMQYPDVGVTQSELEIGNIDKQSVSEQDVPFMQFEACSISPLQAAKWGSSLAGDSQHCAHARVTLVSFVPLVRCREPADGLCCLSIGGLT
jgi:hypothetical protein